MRRRTIAGFGARGVAFLTLAVLFIALFVGAVEAGSGQWEMRVCADAVSLPFSSEDRSGFENRIADILADELNARVTYDWHRFNADLINLRLLEGTCDLLLGVPDGYRNLLTTLSYYQSPYVFVYRSDSPFEVNSLDDPVLRQLRIGVQNVGMPPYESLSNRGLTGNVTETFDNSEGDEDRLSAVVDAVARGDIDVGITWGPEAGYYAQRHDVPLSIVPVEPRVEPPAIFMTMPMTIAVRQGDEALRDRLNVAIAERWDAIQAVLTEYGVPLDPVPKPLLTTGTRGETSNENVLRIGLVIPTRTAGGHGSLYDIVGEAARLGAVLAEEDFGGGSEPGTPVLDVLFASAPSADAALRAGERLLATEKVHALVGGLGTGQAEVLAAVAEEHEVPFLNIGSPSVDLRRTRNRYTFHVAASADMYLDAFVDRMASEGDRRWFVVYEDNEDGRELWRYAQRAITDRDGNELVGSAGVSVGQPTYFADLNAIRDADADVVLLLVHAADQIAFLGQLGSVGLDVEVAPFPYPITQTRDFLASAHFRYDVPVSGERLALWETTLMTARAGELNERFISRWGKPMDPPAWAAYEAINMLYQSAAATGSPDGADLVAYLEDPGTSFDTAKGPGATFRPWDNQLRQQLYAVRVNPEAEWGITAAEQVEFVDLVGIVPAGDDASGTAAGPLDRSGDGPEASDS